MITLFPDTFRLIYKSNKIDIEYKLKYDCRNWLMPNVYLLPKSFYAKIWQYMHIHTHKCIINYIHAYNYIYIVIINIFCKQYVFKVWIRNIYALVGIELQSSDIEQFGRIKFKTVIEITHSHLSEYIVWSRWGAIKNHPSANYYIIETLMKHCR